MTRLKEAEKYFATNGRLIAHDQKWLLAELKRAQAALRVIQTWASVDGALVPQQVVALCERTLTPEVVRERTVPVVYTSRRC